MPQRAGARRTTRARLLLGAAALLVATTARADDYLLLRAAQAELQLARSYLQVAGHDYEGHRRAALDAVNLALKELRQELDALRKEREGTGTAAPEPES